MSADRLRRALRFGIAALVLLLPLPFGAVTAGWVLVLELSAAALGLVAILLIAKDPEATGTLPKLPMAVCAGLILLGIFQIVPWPWRIAQTFNPTADLLRPLLPYLGLKGPPSVSWSVAAPETTDACLRFIAYVLIGAAAALAYDSRASRRRFAGVLAISAVFQAVYGSSEYLTGRNHIFAFAKKHYLESATGTFINRNHFATFLAIALPFALTLAIPDRSEAHPRGWRARLIALADEKTLVRTLAIAACALIWLGLLLSHSRAGLLAALAGAAVVLIHYRSTRAARWAAAIGAAVLLALLSMRIAQAPGERFLDVERDVAAKGGRLTVWHDAAALVRSRPVLGWGYGTFESAFPSVQSADISLLYDHAHNDWLEWTTEGGVLTLAAAIALFVWALRRGSTASRAAILAVGLHAMWDFSLRIPAVAMVVAMAMGVGWREYWRAAGEQHVATSWHRPVPEVSSASANSVTTLRRRGNLWRIPR